MGKVLRVFSHRQGPWLVQAGTVTLGVPREIGLRLLPLDGKKTSPHILRGHLAQDGSQEALVRKIQDGLEDSPFSWRKIWKRRDPIWLKLSLVPARLVRKIAVPMSGLASPCGFWLWGALGLAGYLAPRMVGPRHPSEPLQYTGIVLGVLLFFFSALWHEIGHAAALEAAGYTPGGLGLGMLTVFPVLFVDVTPVALLPRGGRIRVNLAGPLFQLAGAGVYQLTEWVIPLPAIWAGGLKVAAASATLAVTWSLWPFIRSDGYWLVCDALGIESLDRPLSSEVRGRTRILAMILRLANMVFLLAVGVVLTLTLQHRFGMLNSERLFSSGQQAVRAWACVALAVVVWLGLLSRVLFMGRLVKSDLCQA